jgi:mannosyltransferase OCH1-like enzyme
MIFTLRLTSGRILKFIGAISKTFSYVFHSVVPHHRFRIPAQSNAIWLRDNEKDHIPRTLWQTNYTEKVTFPVYINYLVNRLMGLSFNYRFMTTGDRMNYIKDNFPSDIYDCYRKLQIGAAQADLWRLLVIYREGGVYMDIDAHAVWPLEFLVARHHELFIATKKGELSNYFLAACPYDPHVKRVIDTVISNIRENKIYGVFDMTGPGAMNVALSMGEVNSIPNRSVCIQGSFSNEYFQYIDKKEGKWTRQQKTTRVVGS